MVEAMRRIRWCVRAAAVGVCMLSVAACDESASQQPSQNAGGSFDSAREVVIYVSTDESIARPILEAFERTSGIRVRARYDSENSKATALAAMIRAERDAPRADVFWSGECFVAAQLAQELLVEPWRSRRADQLPALLRGASGRWYGLAPRVRVLVYDPARTRVDELPASLVDLVDRKWDGRIAIADPRFGTTRGHLGAVAAQFEARAAGGWTAWVNGMAANHPQILSGGNAAVVDAVARGEAQLGLTDTDDVYAAIASGANVAMIALRQLPIGENTGGAMVIPASVAIVANAPHAANASELMSFLLGQDVTRWMHQSTQGTLIVPELAQVQGDIAVAAPPPSGLPLLAERVVPSRINAVDDPFQFDADELATTIDKAIAEFMQACRSEPRQ